jgi:hypothetical protein
MVRRDWFEQVQGFDPALHMAEDWDLFLRLAQAGCPMEWTPAVVCQYRLHAGNSIHDLAQHRDSSLRALDKVLALAGPEADIAPLSAPARAWVHVVFARRALAAGQPDSARGDLAQALALDPALATTGRGQLLEYLFSADTLSALPALDPSTGVVPYLPPALRRHAADIRRAEARAHMAAYFRAQMRGAHGQARAHLGAAVRRDATWLLNRGVLAYYVRRALGRGPRRPAA